MNTIILTFQIFHSLQVQYLVSFTTQTNYGPNLCAAATKLKRWKTMIPSLSVAFQPNKVLLEYKVILMSCIIRSLTREEKSTIIHDHTFKMLGFHFFSQTKISKWSKSNH